MSGCEKSVDRIKLGEIFYSKSGVYEFTCGHCLYDFKQFSSFAAHVQEFSEELIMYERPVKVDGNSDTKYEVETGNVIQEMADKEIEDYSDNDSCISFDIELAHEQSGLLEYESNAKPQSDEDVVCVVISDDDNDAAEEESVGDEENVCIVLDKNGKGADDDYYAVEEIRNEPDRNEVDSSALTSAHKCPLCKSWYITMEFLEMHLINYHSESTIHNYLSAAATSDDVMHATNKKMHIQKSKCIEELPAENILLKALPETAEYSKYLFNFDFPKNARGVNKCPKCDRMGPASILKNHVFTHLKAKLFSCMICKEQFHTIDKIRHHIRKRHY